MPDNRHRQSRFCPARRLYMRLYKRIEKIDRGGGPDMFGFYDWPTLHRRFPQMTAMMRRLAGEFQS